MSVLKSAFLSSNHMNTSWKLCYVLYMHWIITYIQEHEKVGRFISSFLRCGNWGTEWLIDLSKVWYLQVMGSRSKSRVKSKASVFDQNYSSLVFFSCLFICRVSDKLNCMNQLLSWRISLLFLLIIFFLFFKAKFKALLHEVLPAA